MLKNCHCWCGFNSSDTEDEKAHKIWKKSIMLVYRSAATHKYVWWIYFTCLSF